MIASVFPSTNGHHSQPWLKETVQSFFEDFTWSGMAPTSLASPGTSGGGVSSEAMATLTVGQFFEIFPWEGQPTIGVPITPREAPSAAPALSADDLTLDDFSSLFG